jgi:hypothetical protein
MLLEALLQLLIPVYFNTYKGNFLPFVIIDFYNAWNITKILFIEKIKFAGTA